jgi:tetratricopeptide (TPR) repeat protein
MKKKPVTIVAACIAGVAVIAAAVITGGFGLLKPSGPVTTVTTGDKHEGLLMVMVQPENATINYNVPDTDTKKAIDALETKLESASKDIVLNRQEIELLTKALQDLDQRTSGIEKLPDGRTKLGDIITGSPITVTEQHNIAVALLRKNDFANAFQHSKDAIEAYELGQQKAFISSGDLKAFAVAKLYHIGAISAYVLQKYDLAHQWAEKADKAEQNPERLYLLGLTLFKIDEQGKALEVINQGLTKYPDNEPLKALKQEITKRIGPQPRAPADAQ